MGHYGFEQKHTPTELGKIRVTVTVKRVNDNSVDLEMAYTSIGGKHIKRLEQLWAGDTFTAEQAITLGLSIA